MMLKKTLSLLSAGLLAAVPFAASSSVAESDAIGEAIRQETSGEYTIDASLPREYTTSCEQKGTVEEMRYTTYDYFGDMSEYTKRAFVYLPYGYDAARSYKVLVLCHGIGGNEYEWGLSDKNSKVAMIMDRLIMNDEIEPFIVVTPNGKAGNLSRPGTDANTAYMAFYQFGKELRNDLLPWIDEHYSTYGSHTKNLADSRDNRAMAGLSMGGMQTINIGMCECLDLFAWFGAFSACPTTYTSPELAAKLKAFPDETIRYFYNICGTEDNIAYASASGAVRDILTLTDHLSESNYTWQEKPGGHDFGIWYLGFYNFARIFGAK